MRRLPIFLLFDVSESMIGEPIQSIDNGMHEITSILRRNPMALETAYLSIIIFAGKAKTIVPLTEVLKFNPPELPIGGGTALGHAMNYLMDEIDTQVKKTTYETKGDWKPVVFLFTDGAPTDDVSSAISRWNKEYKNRATLIAISMGNQADTSILSKFTDNVLIFNNTEPDSYNEFFKWISASIETKSMNVISTRNDFEFDEIYHDILQKCDTDEENIVKFDEKFIILLFRCQKTKRPYLIKYIIETPKNYILENTHAISEEYFDLTVNNETQLVKTEYMEQLPRCPECDHTSFAYCVCKRLFCCGNKDKYICPWCENEIELNYSSSIDITRTQG